MQKNFFTLPDFEFLCRERGFSRFVFDRSLQRYCRKPQRSHPIKEYKTMLTFLSPNVIVFKNDISTVYIRYVKYISVISDDPSDGLFFDVVFSDNPLDKNEKRISFTAK